MNREYEVNKRYPNKAALIEQVIYLWDKIARLTAERDVLVAYISEMNDPPCQLVFKEDCPLMAKDDDVCPDDYKTCWLAWASVKSKEAQC